MSDSTNRIVMFDSAMTPATFWVRLDDLDLKPGTPVRKLELVGGKTYSGNAADKFIEAKHLKNLLRKLAVTDRTQAAVWAVRGGWSELWAIQFCGNAELRYRCCQSAVPVVG